MSKYVWTDDMSEISGFGGSYEAGCRVMVVAGLEWFDALPKETAEPTFKELEHVAGLIYSMNPQARALTKAMCDAADRAFPKGGVTGAMMQFAVHHVLEARRLGWQAYAEKMREFKSKQGRRR